MTEPTPDWATAIPNDPSIHVMPTTPVDGGALGLPQNQLLTFGQNLISGIVKAVVKAIVGVVFPGDVVAQLKNWAEVLLPAQILQPIYDLVNLLVSLLGPIPIVGTVVQTLADYFGLLHTNTTVATGIGENAQYSADTANAGVALLNAQLAGTGTVFTDTFNRAAATNLGTDYDRTMGSGSGTWGPDGSGNVVWTANGSAFQLCIDRVKTLLSTDYQSAAMVLTNPPRFSGGGGGNPSSRMRLCLRMNTAKTDYVMGDVCGDGTVEIGYVISGAYTRLGSVVTGVPMANGDLWEFRAGTTADAYEFVLLQNNLTVCNRLDSGHVSQRGASNRYGALYAFAGSTQFGFFTVQMEAPTVQILTVADRTP